MNSKLSILSNLAFWQSRTWSEATDSIYGPDQSGEEYSPLLTAWKLFSRRGAYDVVLTMGARESLAYGLLCACLFRPSLQIMTEVFIDDVAHRGWVWRLKTRLYQWVAARSIGILTNSSMEVETMSGRYGMDVSRFRYIPLHTNIHEPEWTDGNEGYIFSAGRTLRDYTCLIEAIEALQIPVHIVCGVEDLKEMAIPDHVTLHREIDRKAYLDLLKGSTLVALPLKATERSTGQVVMLEAMALGKPVITTVAPGTSDYIQDGRNGRLLQAGDSQALREAIEHWLAHPDDGGRLRPAGFG